MTDEVLTRREGVAAIISLNRPKAIHALTTAMCEGMIAALQAWAEDDSVGVVIIEHAEGRGFCAGGDIAMLRRSALEDGGLSGRRFFLNEYRLNHLLFTYRKPVVAFMDGITMGGGVGISQPARFRVATEHTRFAMPESGIGLFPDVGGGWYLSRLPGRVGYFLALTGARLDGAECLWAGLATHYLASGDLDEAKRRIAAGHEIEGVLAALASSAPEAKIAAHDGAIRKHFRFATLEEVIASLDGDKSEWAMKELATLRSKSPQACKVALRELDTSLTLTSFAEEMAMEYRIASRVLVLPDFSEGVRAVIVDKDNAPKWNPDTPEGVREETLEAIFARLPATEEWKPL
ncbi:enoyl-CoA hydratase/isomerase family protein [Novosphingobium sp. 1949]|uniref:3-hydroxyisobutyryl-CoA hydrolase n=1 Tax=Novosphingobium organovorum TaxID=2930092 RepID=A0ABT0B9U0_9SPHN|nr:enoyl-CoA hydratase/isomerase family protein [Novosphingobium organovorum]MCJ2181559.1 enoyl-CoA hydratase/isomerase family protein [Novosphingobium organovorum]